MLLLNLVQENLLMKNRIVCSLNSACQIAIGAINFLIRRPEAEGTGRCLNTSTVTVEKRPRKSETWTLFMLLYVEIWIIYYANSRPRFGIIVSMKNQPVFRQ